MSTSAEDYTRGHADGLAGANFDGTASVQYDVGYSAGATLRQAQSSINEQRVNAGIPIDWSPTSGGGIDFDQENEGTSLSIRAEDSNLFGYGNEADLAVFALNPANDVDPLDGVSGIVVNDGWATAAVRIAGQDSVVIHKGDVTTAAATIVVSNDILLTVGAPEGEPENPGDISLIALGTINLVASGEGGIEFAGSMGFFGATAGPRPEVTGSTADEKIDSLIAAFAALGLITDAT